MGGKPLRPRVLVSLSKKNLDYVEEHCEPEGYTKSKFVGELCDEAIRERKRLLEIGVPTGDVYKDLVLQAAYRLQQIARICAHDHKDLKELIRYGLESPGLEEGVLTDMLSGPSQADAARQAANH